MASRNTFIGLFFVALASLMFELLLVRIFSVTMWYHFAFMAVSIAMFGMTVGSLAVYLLPDVFKPEKTQKHLAVSALVFAASLLLSFWLHLCIRFVPYISWIGILSLAATYLIISLPFIFSGICICLALTRFPQAVSKLYAADLCGAAIGCIALLLLLKSVDGISAVIVVAFLACIGALFFAFDCIKDSRRIFTASAVITVLTAAFLPINMQFHLMKLRWVKGLEEQALLYEKWNSFSRIRVYGNPDEPYPVKLTGLSKTADQNIKVRSLFLDIDNLAGTVLFRNDGDVSKMSYLRDLVASMAHILRPHANVLVIGVGGGIDILSALTFDQKTVTGVEINDIICDVLRNKFADYTGHIDKNPHVNLVNDEARSFIARSKEKFDIIQITLIDTWAATSAGAYALTENSLYTMEAWRIYLEHLSPHGVVSCCRWYPAEHQYEIDKIVCLAAEALKKRGVSDPRKNMIVVRSNKLDGSEANFRAVGNLMVSPSAFSTADIENIRKNAERLQFEVVLDPLQTSDPLLPQIIANSDNEAFLSTIPARLTPPTDDSPFFFQMARLRDWQNLSFLYGRSENSFNMVATCTLVSLFIIVLILTATCVILPLVLTLRRKPSPSSPSITALSLKDAAPMLVYFCCIGIGFMLVEISQIQRLSVFLGHPIYSLAAVLFTLLTASALGSFSTS
jgi:hypothetical protein